MKGGFREGSGRKKGSQNKSTREIRELLDEHRTDLLNVAIERAKNGSDVLMSKLLDKLLPTLNQNENLNKNIDSGIKGYLEKKREELKLLKFGKEKKVS